MAERRTVATGRIIVFQPALPRYRLDFFERVAQRLGENFSVHFSPTDMGALTDVSPPLWSRQLGPLRSLAPGAIWQPGVIGFPIRRGDIIVISGSLRNISNMLMLAKAKLTGATSVWWGQYRSRSKARLRLHHMLMRGSSAVLLYTDDEVAAYRSVDGNRLRPVVGLNNGIDVDSIARLRQPYDPAARGRTILFIGRLTAKAQLILLLQALADNRLAYARLHVIGDGAEQSPLRAAARSLGVDDRVAWHDALVDEAQIAAVANRCRLFVYPGDVGLSLIHAMAYSLPGVVHDDDEAHMPEIAAFRAARNGLTFAKGDAGSLAQAIEGAFRRTEMDPSWPQASLRIADEQFNTRVMADRFCDLIESLASRQGTP